MGFAVMLTLFFRVAKGSDVRRVFQPSWRATKAGIQGALTPFLFPRCRFRDDLGLLAAQDYGVVLLVVGLEAERWGPTLVQLCREQHFRGHKICRPQTFRGPSAK